jgi:stage II sporulation protein D
VRVVAKQSGTLVVNGTTYRGDLIVRAATQPPGLLVVNRANLEEYVAGVVGSEMPLLFPEQALRAQAVASRTYALYALRSREADAFDVADDQSSQVYRGLANETDRARKVTLDTLGVILTYRGRVFNSYFHSTCGGETIPASWVFGEAPIPPLSGAPCGFCADSKYYRWRASVTRVDLAAKLAKEGFPVGRVDRVEVLERGPAGHVALVRILHAGGEVRVKGAKLRAILGTSAVRSTAFDIEDPGGDAIALAGRGWGHGVGLCQFGARGMAQAGYDALAILRRYYPAAELVRIYTTDVPPAGAAPGAGGEASVGRP